MNSSKVGKDTSKIEVTNISPHGLWIYIKNKEYFIPFDKFPWFKEGKIHEVMDVKYLHEDHLYWPALDVDLTIDQLENPHDYPLIYKNQ
mgnify:CR=1 FL=1